MQTLGEQSPWFDWKSNLQPKSIVQPLRLKTKANAAHYLLARGKPQARRNAEPPLMSQSLSPTWNQIHLLHHKRQQE